MGYWNYRVVKYTDEDGSYGIHEAHYENGEAKPYAITESAVGIVADNVRDLSHSLTHMAEALRKPILDYQTREEIETGTGFPKRKNK